MSSAWKNVGMTNHLIFSSFYTLEIWVAAATRAAPPILISVCSITVCPNSGMAASVWDF